MLKLPPEVARALYRLRRGQWPIALAFLILLMPGVAGRGPSRRVVVQCQEPDAGEFAVDAFSVPLPMAFPEAWLKAPCPRSEGVRVVRGRCFVATKERPPCVAGYDYEGECLVALKPPRPIPTSIQR